MSQSQWRFCQNCSVMFFGGRNRNAGVCVRPDQGRAHIGEGFEFSLPFSDGPEAPNTQQNWAFCRKCSSLVWVGIGGDAGVCVGGGGHDTTGSLNFHLPHDIPEAPSLQQNWRFCRKCHCMFFGGNPGTCVRGGGHDGTGSFNFVLQHGSTFIPPSVPIDPGPDLNPVNE